MSGDRPLHTRRETIPRSYPEITDNSTTEPTDPLTWAETLLVNRHDRALRLPSTGTGIWYASTAAITRTELTKALTGRTVLGLYSLGIDGLSRWYCLDADTDDSFDHLLRFLQRLEDKTGIYVERSRRGGHAWVFHDPVPWHTANFTGTSLAEAVGYPQMEVYPKHAGLNAVRCPGSLHPKTGRAYPAIDLTTGELLPALDALATVRRTSLEMLHFHERRGVTGYSGETTPGDFADLVSLLSSVTRLRVYGPDKAIGRCLWHDDRNPSLYVKGGRFHCLSTNCKAWGSIVDLKRYLSRGILPPRG